MSLSATDKRALQTLKSWRTFAELADAMGARADSRRRALDSRLQALVRDGLVKREDERANPRAYKATVEGLRRLEAAVRAERRRAAPAPRSTTERDW